MKLHDDKLELGDRVYDVSVGRGFGEVIEITESSYFQVRFSRYSINYTPDGVQQGKAEQTLYWSKPLVIQPRKNEQRWQKKKDLVQEFFTLVKNYSEFM